MKTLIIDVDNHIHGGQKLAKGDELTVNDQTAAWMIARNKAHEKTAVSAPSKTKTEDK